MKTTIIIPTYNGGSLWHNASQAISTQVRNDISVLTIDSSSSDNTRNISRNHNFVTTKIDASDFNHGGTRNTVAFSLVDSDVVIFLTQDSIPQPECIERIVAVFNNPSVAVAYGRQLPHDDANPLAIHARTFNYKNESVILGIEDKDSYGIKTVFSSNSFAAYRVCIFKRLGGFPTRTILSEDMYFAARAVMAGYKTAYVADAMVKHSHNYSPWEEFKRYFDIGVFHHEEKWIRENFGGAGGEGKKYILSEFCYLIKNNPLWIPRACVHNLFKIVGYKLGQNYKKIPTRYVKKISMHKGYWK